MARKTILRNKTGTLSLNHKCFIELRQGRRIRNRHGRYVQVAYFRIKARNGRILCHSEQYTQPSKALAAARLIADTAIIPIYERT